MRHHSTHEQSFGQDTAIEWIASIENNKILIDVFWSMIFFEEIRYVNWWGENVTLKIINSYEWSESRTYNMNCGRQKSNKITYKVYIFWLHVLLISPQKQIRSIFWCVIYNLLSNVFGIRYNLMNVLHMTFHFNKNCLFCDFYFSVQLLLHKFVFNIVITVIVVVVVVDRTTTNTDHFCYSISFQNQITIATCKILLQIFIYLLIIFLENLLNRQLSFTKQEKSEKTAFKQICNSPFLHLS